jgi:hypothetical protein
VEGQRLVVADFALVAGVVSAPGTWQNKQLLGDPLFHNNHKRAPQMECCIHGPCGLDFHNSCKKEGSVPQSEPFCFEKKNATIWLE